jgi:hypothetical protein
VLRSSGPSVEDLERTERWNAWLKSYFVEVGKAIGLPSLPGAHRRFGDFEFSYDATNDGFIHLYVATTANMVLIDRDIIQKWDQVEPADVAAAMLAKVREIQAHPMSSLSAHWRTGRANRKR